MLFGRCAWHRHYHGYPLVNGIVSWRGLRLRFTDGICRVCLDRFRAEHRRFLERRPPRRLDLYENGGPDMAPIPPNVRSAPA